MYWIYSCLSASLDYTLRLAKVYFQVSYPCLQYLQEDCCILSGKSKYSASNLLCNLSTLQGCLCSCWLNRFFEPCFWVLGFGDFLISFYVGVVFPFTSAVALTSWFFSYPMVMHQSRICELEFVILKFWKAWEQTIDLQSDCFSWRIGMCMFFILQVSQYLFVKRIFIIKSVILWETVEKKICFTKTNAFNEHGKESS